MRIYLVFAAFLCFASVVLSENPYRVIGMAPYNSMEEIKNKCKKLVIKFHPDKYKGDKNEARAKFDKVQKACKEIKESRGEEDESTTGFEAAMKKCLSSIIVSVILIVMAYFFTMFLHKFFSYTMKFSLISSTTFFVIDSFYAHHFENEEAQYTWSFLISVFILCLDWFRGRMFRKPVVVAGSQN